MSHKGPSLRRTKDGLTIAKFNGNTFRFGNWNDPLSHLRFATCKARWEAAGRQLTAALMEAARAAVALQMRSLFRRWSNVTTPTYAPNQMHAGLGTTWRASSTPSDRSRNSTARIRHVGSRSIVPAVSS